VTTVGGNAKPHLIIEPGGPSLLRIPGRERKGKMQDSGLIPVEAIVEYHSLGPPIRTSSLAGWSRPGEDQPFSSTEETGCTGASPNNST
jgi:hypothetical protein